MRVEVRTDGLDLGLGVISGLRERWGGQEKGEEDEWEELGHDGSGDVGVWLGVAPPVVALRQKMRRERHVEG
ncbi:MAG: hypothetical protein CO108_05735 [Deltaproteobacteria bacterium CG_4_9_14_3_um_filter_63_12]|nr:MAG: hypothetical protein CO108_05735 [Deltaproteobacteria bacterium CG_4_9_14_3_um_filter_63_12]